MRIYDISQEVFSCNIYPGDPRPEKQMLCATDAGDLYNLTAFSMCAHNGTHIDAPLHFLPEGKSVADLPLDAFVGQCYVARLQGDITAADACRILEKAKGIPRILIAGQVTLTEAAAKVFAGSHIRLYGNEGQTVGPGNAPMQVHKILLQQQIVLLEGIVLTQIPEGSYFLSAAPLNLAGADGAPCRAYLIGE